jgi:hypothetical protein
VAGWPVYSQRLDARTITTPNTWIDAYAVPTGFKVLVRYLTGINTGPDPSTLILGYGSGHQILRWTAQPPNTVLEVGVWIVYEELEVIQWQISASSWQVSLHGQLLRLP